MVIGSHEPEQRIVQPRLLGTEKNRVSPVKRAKPSRGKPPLGFAGWLVARWLSEQERIKSTFFKNPEDVAGLAEVKAV